MNTPTPDQRKALEQAVMAVTIPYSPDPHATWDESLKAALKSIDDKKQADRAMLRAYYSDSIEHLFA